MAFLTAFLQLIHCKGQMKWRFSSSLNNNYEKFVVTKSASKCLIRIPSFGAQWWLFRDHEDANKSSLGGVVIVLVFRQTSPIHPAAPSPHHQLDVSQSIIWVFRQNVLYLPNNLDMCQSEWYWHHPSKNYCMQSSPCQLEPASHDFSPPLGKCWDTFTDFKFSEPNCHLVEIRIASLKSLAQYQVTFHSPECLKAMTATVLYTQWWEELEENSAEFSLLLNHN